MKTYEVKAHNLEFDAWTTTGRYESMFAALIAIEEATDEDLKYGEYDNYEYYINDERIR